MRSNADEHAVTTNVEQPSTRQPRRWTHIAFAVLTIASLAGVGDAASASTNDPPSTYAGVHLTVRQAAQAAFSAGFHTEGSLLAVISIGIAESGLVTKARNWHPEFGYRPASARIGVRGPAAAWNARHTRQMNSDRGAWQISSRAWARYTDAQTDNPASAARIMFSISHHGTDFSPWDTYTSGTARQYFDSPHDGWPAIRPIVRSFLASVRK